jgi:quercetin dioxygenase-like cupin family protein
MQAITGTNKEETSGAQEQVIRTGTPIIRGAGEGERRWFAGGGVFTIKATAAETNGAFFLIEDRIVRGKSTPFHLHPYEDETLIVLEGELLVSVGGTEQRVGPRGAAVFPRGVPHAFVVTSESALILGLQTPGSGEAFYRDASDPVSGDVDPARPPDWGRLWAAAQRHPDIIQILGPSAFGTT